MAWSPQPSLDLPEPTQGWFDTGEIPHREPVLAWVGQKKVPAESAGAVAVLVDPEPTSGATVFVPGVSTLVLPFEFPAQFAGRPQPHGGAVLLVPQIVARVDAPACSGSVELLPPDLVVGEDFAVSPPVMVASAGVETPVPSLGTAIIPPAMLARVPANNGFPYEFPWLFGQEGFFTPTVEATNQAVPDALESSAALSVPTVVSGAEVAAAVLGADAVWLTPIVGMTPPGVESPPLGAAAGLGIPGVASGAGVDGEPLSAAAAMYQPVVASGNVAAGVIAESSAGLHLPVVASGGGVVAEACGGSAELLVPVLDVSAAPSAEPPPMGADATALAPVVTVGHVVAAPVMAASAAVVLPSPQMGVSVSVGNVMGADAEASGFPFTFPFPLGEASGILRPELSTWTDLAEPEALAASAQIPAPTPRVGVTVAVPAMTAGAAVVAPSVTAGATVAAPVASSSAAMPLPNHGPPAMSPAEVSYTSAYTYNIPAHAIFIDIICLGGGRGGKDGGGGFSEGRGGQGGQWGTQTLRRGVHVDWSVSTITGSAGAAGTRSGNNGGNSTATVSGYGTVTGSGGSSDASGQNGDGGGSQTVSGVTYTRGNGGTGNGGAGAAPGGGGAGGNGGLFSGSNGGNGAAGRVWFRAYQ